MLLPQHTINSFKHYLSLFFMAIDKDKPMSDELKRKLDNCERNLANGTIDEITFENFINELVIGLDEHMFVWKIVAKAKASQFMRRGASFLMLVTAPDLKTCIEDTVKYKSLLLPESYQLKFYTEGDSVVFEVTDKGFDSPLPHIKYDTAIGMGLFHFREVAGHDFDFDEIYVPLTRKHFDEKVIRKTSKASIKRDNGAMRATFNKRWLSHKNEFYDEHLRAQVKKQLELLIEEFQYSGSLVSEVTNIIKRSQKPAALTLENVAEHLGKSVSTFRRNLGEEKTSFKILQGKVLDEICLDALLLSDLKIEALAIKLGYSERSTFERSFKNKFGTTPAKFREFRERLTGKSKEQGLGAIINQLPPLPDSCLQLIERAEDSNLQLEHVVGILEKDPVFAGRVMGLASKAIYGATPSNLNQAVGRNLGLETIKNLAVLYAAEDSLSVHIKGFDIPNFINATTMAPRIFKLLTRNMKGLEFDSSILDQCMLFGNLGMLVLCHKQYEYCEKITFEFESSNNFHDFLNIIYNEYKVSFFGTSTLLLSYWGLNNEIIRLLTAIDQKLASGKQLNKLESLIILTSAVCIALEFSQTAFESLDEQANSLGITNFTDKWNSFSTI